jgi:DNA polymerase (family 10)
MSAADAAKRSAEIERARAGPMRILHALEVDLDDDGALQTSESLLGRADFVVARVDPKAGVSREHQTRRLLAAIAHPRVAMLSQPTGRIINRREAADADWPRVMHAAADRGVALELSGDPDRLDLTDLHCRMARDAGAVVAIGSNAGAPAELDRLSLAVTQARRGWLEPQHVLNTAPFDALSKALAGGGAAKRTARRARAHA